jgi:pyruvate kinase
MARTRIVATLGPATASQAGVRALLDAGVDVFRLNFSHGTQAEHGRTIEIIRGLAGERPVAILQDLGGPKLRLDRPVSGKPGDVVELELPATVRRGDPVLLADGLMQLEVVDARHGRVVVGGNIPAGKGINLPSSRLDMPALTAKDEADLRFGVEKGVDYVALSFVSQAADLAPVRATGVPVVAKIERAEAVGHMEEIVAAADGIMVARGDLGVEVPIERVPVVQKELIALANLAGKPVITATQLLRSMVDSPLPTRAEATDVANAVLDGTDAVMLSEETAVGRYPSEAVRVMDRIMVEAERLLVPRPGSPSSAIEDTMAEVACTTAERIGASAIVVLTRSGFTARKVALHRPRVPILALASDEAVRRRLALVWGVLALPAPGIGEPEMTLAGLRAVVQGTGLVQAGHNVVLTSRWPFSELGTPNFVHVTSV